MTVALSLQTEKLIRQVDKGITIFLNCVAVPDLLRSMAIAREITTL